MKSIEGFRLAKRFEFGEVEVINFIRDKMFELERKGKRIIRMDMGDSNFDLPQEMKKGIEKALQSGKIKYPPQGGLPELREKLREKLKRQNKIHAEPEGILLTNGGMGGLFNTFFSLLDPGDEVILLQPFWSPLKYHCLYNDAKPIYVSLDENFQLDPDRIRKAITSRTKVIYINTPNNPSGSIFGREAIEEVAKIGLENRVWILSDEPYEDILFEGEHFSIASLPGVLERSVTTFSFSKTYAATGLRVGYAVTGNKDLAETLIHVDRQVSTGVNTLTQLALCSSEIDPNEIERMRKAYETRMELLYQGLSQLEGVSCVKPRGGFFMFPDFSSFIPQKVEGRSFFIADRLLEQGVAVVPGIAFGDGKSYEGHVRLNFSNLNESEISEALEIFQKTFLSAE
ncbi:pyridoxal phosphate-dependent aminotransferase [candidate division TA06 bacterium]|nr:pyridoxal phosphate-dependent aminotransferase [candidate division TA06 bacterium]